MTTPVITEMEVYPVTGKDCMGLNLSGAHVPYFTRDAVALCADNGEMGVGGVPGDERIINALERCTPLVGDAKIAERKSTLLRVKRYLDSKGEEDVKGNQTFNPRIGVHVITTIEASYLDLLGKHLGVPVCELLGERQRRGKVRMLGYLFLVGDRNETDLVYDAEPDADYKWCRTRHEEALIADRIMAFAKATKEEYGFQDLKLKGGVLVGNEETDVIQALKKEFSDTRIDLDSSGGWLFGEVIEHVGGMQGILTYCEDPCGAESVYSGREIMSELRRRTGFPTATNMIATDQREVGRSLESQTMDTTLADPHFWTVNGSVRVAQIYHDFGYTQGSHSNNHSDISPAMSTQVGTAVPGECDALDIHWIWQEGMERLTKEPLQIVDGYVAAPRKPKFGIEVNVEQVKKVHQLYLDYYLGGRDNSVVMQYLIPG